MNRIDNIKEAPLNPPNGGMFPSPFGGVGGGFVYWLICGLMFLFSACDRNVMPEVPEDDPESQTGELVTVVFSISTDGLGSNEVVTRKSEAPLNPPEGGNYPSPFSGDGGIFSQTILISPPSGELEGALYMYVALQEEEPPVTMRAAYPITPAGTIVRIVAYGGVSYTDSISHADYIVAPGGALSPVTNPLVVPSGSTKFVAYSYHTNAPLPPFNSPILTSIHARDLMWGTTTELVDRTGFPVHITMYHQYSSVVLDAQLDFGAPSPPSSITSFNLTQPGIDAFDPDYDILSGTIISSGPVVNFEFTRSSTLPTLPNWISDSLHIYSHSVSPTIVRFASIEINGRVYLGPFEAQFNKAILPGSYYTLIVRFMQMPDYANILHIANDGTLSAGLWKDGNITAQNILYFKYGSVVGFTAPPPPPSSQRWSTTLISFNPTNSTFTSYNANNGGVPCLRESDTPQITNISNSNYHNGTNVLLGKGDPCKLVGLKASTIRGMTAQQINDHNSNWIMPLANDHIDFVRAPVSWYNSTVNFLSEGDVKYWGNMTVNSQVREGGWFPIPGNPDATTGRLIRNTNPNGFLPAMGVFTPDGNGNNAQADFTNYYQNAIGSYWSSQVLSSGNNATSGYLLFDSSTLTPVALSNFIFARSVRCKYIGPPPNSYGVSVEDWDNGGQLGTGSEGDVNL